MSFAGFGEVRALLEQRPSTIVFGALMQRLGDLAARDEDHVREVLLSYIHDKLAGWPESARLCPKHRLREYESGEPVWCELVRALDYQDMKLEEDTVTKLLQVPGIEHITHLDLTATEISWAQLARLATSAPFRLESFAMSRDAKIDWDALDALFSSPMLSTTKRLSFRGWAKIRVDVYKHLAEHFPLENLRALDVSGGAMSARKLGELVQTGRLDQLEEFYARTWTTEAFKPGMIGVLAQRASMQNLRVIDVAMCKAKELDALATAEHLSSLRELRFGTASELSRLDAVLRAPHLSKLESLSLFTFDLQSRVYETVLHALAAPPVSERMRALQFMSVRRTYVDADADTLLGQQQFLDTLQAGGFRHLTKLCVELNSWMMHALADHAVALPELEQLMVFTRRAASSDMHEAARRLFTRQNFPKLDTLIVNMNDPAPLFDAIEHNDLAITKLKVITYGEEALSRLLGGEYLARVEVLDLSSMSYHANSELLEVLFTSPHLKRLRAVVVDGWSNIDKAARLLATHPSMEPGSVYVSTIEDASLKTFDWFDAT